jgi:hypothetical protein
MCDERHPTAQLGPKNQRKIRPSAAAQFAQVKIRTLNRSADAADQKTAP